MYKRQEHGYKVGLATSSREIHAQPSLETVGLWQYFDGGVFGDSVKHAKPDPEIYLKACEAIGTEPVHSIAPVSYTHLDVYKRQGCG